MTREWKDKALTPAMEKRGWNRSDLAKELGVTRGLITKLFADQVASSLVPRICELLEIAMPMSPTRKQTPRDSKVTALLRKMSDDQKDKAIDFIESLMK